MLHGGASGDGPSLFVASSWALCINAQCAAEPNAGSDGAPSISSDVRLTGFMTPALLPRRTGASCGKAGVNEARRVEPRRPDARLDVGCFFSAGGMPAGAPLL
jgi:hypothetical protein